MVNGNTYKWTVEIWSKPNGGWWNTSNFHTCEQMVDFARASGKEKAPCCHRDLHVNSHEHDVRIFFVRSASGVERKEGRKEGRKQERIVWGEAIRETSNFPSGYYGRWAVKLIPLKILMNPRV